MKKKSNFTGTAIAFVVVLAIALYAYVFEFKKAGEAKEQAELDKRVLGFEKQDITRIELHRQSGRLVLQKEGNAWQMLEPVQDSADDVAVDTLLSGLTDEKSIETVAQGEQAKNLSTYGLDQPVTKLVAQVGERKKEIKIGSVKSFDEKLYAQVDNNPKVLLVNSSWDVYLSKTEKDLRNKRIMRQSRLEADRIRIIKGGGQIAEFAKKDSKWSLGKGGDTTAALSDKQINAYVEQVKAAKGDDFASENKTGEGKKFLRGNPSLEVEMSKEGDPSYRLEIYSAKSVKTDNYAVSNDTNIVFHIAPNVVSFLGKAAEDFFDKKAPFEYPAEKITGLEVSQAGTHLKLKKAQNAWILETPIEGKELNTPKVDELLGSMAGLEADRFGNKAANTGISSGKNEIVLKDDKGEKLFQINWGALFTEKGENEAETKKFYYVKTSKSGQTLLLRDDKIDEMPIAALLKDKVATK